METRGSSLTTTGKIFCNKAVYSLVRITSKGSLSETLSSPWHWYRFPFSLKGNVLWSRSLPGWFVAENESSIECMLHMENYEPTEWVAPKNGDVFLDIGAFVGWHAIRAARLVGPSGRVISLEPDLTNRSQLETNLSLNGVANCETSSLAAWSKTGEELGWYTEKSPDCCRIAEMEHSVTVKTRTTTIDDLVDNIRLERLNWIKMDVEGAEIEALKGAQMTLRRYRPDLFVEIHDTVDGVKDLLAEYDYSIEREAYDGSPKPHGWFYAHPR
jgi:FkbM family methyltransferase